jgi:hypothetical protein
VRQLESVKSFNSGRTQLSGRCQESTETTADAKKQAVKVKTMLKEKEGTGGYRQDKGGRSQEKAETLKKDAEKKKKELKAKAQEEKAGHGRTEAVRSI